MKKKLKSALLKDSIREKAFKGAQMPLTLNQLLEGKNRIWDINEWLMQSKEFIESEIELRLSNRTISEKFYRKNELTHIFELLNKKEVFTEDQCHQIQIATIFYLTKEYHLADEYLKPLIDHLVSKNENETLIISHLYSQYARVLLEKADFRNANEYFLRAYGLLIQDTKRNDHIYFILNWLNLFIEIKHIGSAESLLILISNHLAPQTDDTYAKLLFMQFLCQKKSNHLDACINWINMLLSLPSEHLDEDDWYTLHIFAGEYYASVKRSFEKSIYHFTFANSFLSLKWKYFINQITTLKDFLKLSDYLKIRIAYEDKMHEIILENNLHSSHYLNSLKSAYQELEEIYKKVREMSLTDSLTGLHNRRYLWEKVPDFLQLASSQQVPISSLMIDFDDFKKINDQYGHQTGDEILRQVSDIIKEFFRKSDLVIRFGGEEVLVFLLNSNAKNTKKICEELRSNIANFIFSIKNEMIRLTVSIGISNRDKVDHREKVIEEMIEEADLAMYHSKAHGKNQVSIYKKTKKKK